MSQPKRDRSPKPVKIAESIEVGAQNRLDKILELWRIGLKDPDRSIRLFTLMATVSGFFLMFLLILFGGSLAVWIVQGTKPELRWFFLSGGGAVTPVFVLGLPAAWRKSERVNAEILAAGFEKVYSTRYGRRVNR